MDNNRYRRGGLITGDYHFHDANIEFEDASLRPKQFIESEPVQLLFREVSEGEYRTEIDGDLKVNGETVLGSLTEAVTILGNVNISGVLSAPNLTVDGDALPNNPSFHNITVSDHISGNTAALQSAIIQDVHAVTIDVDTITPKTGETAIALLGKLTVQDAIETPRIEGSQVVFPGRLVAAAGAVEELEADAFFTDSIGPKTTGG